MLSMSERSDLSGKRSVPSQAVSGVKPEPVSVGAPPAGNTATGWLKIIALVFMLIDHAGAVIWTGIPELRMLGRIAFPIYCWCMIVGFHYTRSVPKYLLRILIVGILSQPLYAFALNHLDMSYAAFRNLFASIPSKPANIWAVLRVIFHRPNIFLTLFLGLLGLWGIRERKGFSQIWAPVIVIALATLLNADYGWKGIVFILLLYACRHHRPAVAAVMIAFFLFWGTGYSLTRSILGIPVDLDALPNLLQGRGLSFSASLVRSLSAPVAAFLRMETYALLSLPFILIPFRKNLRLPVWVSYGFYPAHLLVIMLLKAVFT